MLTTFDLSGSEISAHFVGEKRICQLHEKYFEDPTPTDCITLSYERPGPMCHFLGEMFICPKVALGYANKSGEDLYKEITLYVIHCFLHLLGFEDTTDKKREKMKEEEKKIMQILEKKDLLVTP